MTREEAIKVVRNIYQTDKEKEALETLIPELKESEDERIRKGLIEALKTSKTVGELKFILPEPTREECIAYLEKQKDASKAIEAVDRIDKYIDEHLANAHDMKDSNPDKKYYRGWDDALGKMAGILQDVYSDEKQKEQKPTDRFEEARKKYQVEWSEKDGKMMNEIITIMDGGKVTSGTYLSEYAAWLKNLPERFNLQPKKEWSEEDEMIRNAILGFLNPDKGGTKYSSNAELVEWSNWLKSLRPPQDRCKDCPHRGDMFLLTQGIKSGKHDLAIKFMDYLDENRPEGKMGLSNAECEDIDKAFKENDWAKIIRYMKKYSPSWKPSEEQIKAIESCFCEFGEGCPDEDGLRSLYNDLKKLM